MHKGETDVVIAELVKDACMKMQKYLVNFTFYNHCNVTV
jgi:hypothetical protein